VGTAVVWFVRCGTAIVRLACLGREKVCVASARDSSGLSISVRLLQFPWALPTDMVACRPRSDKGRDTVMWPGFRGTWVR